MTASITNLPEKLVNNGYKRSDKFPNNTVPGVIARSVFSVSDSRLEEFHRYLCNIYENEMLKPVLEVVAVHMLSKNDLIIKYGFEGASKSHGCYLSTSSPVGDYIESLSNIEKELIISVFKTQSILRDLDPYGEMRQILISVPHPKSDDSVEETIVHEFSHMVADIIFDNYCLGYQKSNQDAANRFEEANNTISKHVLFILMPEFSDMYESIDHFEINKIVEWMYSHGNGDREKDEKYKEFLDKIEKSGIMDLFNTIFVPSLYNGTYLVETENFARFLEGLYTVKSHQETSMLFNGFKSYIDLHLNPAFANFFNSNQIYVERLPGLKKYIDFELKELSESEQLYFAIVFNDNNKIEELIKSGVDVNKACFGLTRPITAAVLSNNKNAVKLLAETGDLELDYYDIKCLKNNIKYHIEKKFPHFKPHFSELISSEELASENYVIVPEEGFLELVQMEDSTFMLYA